MKIQYVSDLHLEFQENASYIKRHTLPVVGDVLVIAGDTLYLGKYFTQHPFWDWCAENYKQTIVCMGNHEFYQYYDLSSMQDGTDIEIRPNVHAYFNKVVRLEDIDLVVSTMWSFIPPEDARYTEHYISDFHRILYGEDLLTANDFNREHQRYLAFIKKAVAESKAKKKIVVTHHVPSFQMQDPRFAGSRANGGFTVELQDYIKDSGIDYWIYGHSHHNVDVKIGNTWCVSNQLGYVFHGENETFNPAKIIEL